MSEKYLSYQEATQLFDPATLERIANAGRATTQIVWKDGAKVDLKEDDLNRIEQRLLPFTTETWAHTRQGQEEVGPIVIPANGNPERATAIAFALAELQPNVVLELISMARAWLNTVENGRDE